MRVLLSNDDGYGADGLHALLRTLEKETDWECWVLAPDRERSATSMSLSIFRELELRSLETERHFELDGFPADCVNAALHLDFFPSFDLVLSGINQGPNLGDDVHYSGTVAAARQAALKGLRAAALSAPVHPERVLSGMFPMARFAVDWLKRNLDQMKPGVVYNINFPALSFEELPADDALPEELPELRYTRQGRRTYHDHYEMTPLSEGRYRLGLLDTKFGFVEATGSDFEAVHSGYISITPLSTYTTDREDLERWQRGKV